MGTMCRKCVDGTASYQVVNRRKMAVYGEMQSVHPWTKLKGVPSTAMVSFLTRLLWDIEAKLH
jgi:hypothetical protein